jgi:hypothetical protein
VSNDKKETPFKTVNTKKGSPYLKAKPMPMLGKPFQIPFACESILETTQPMNRSFTLASPCSNHYLRQSKLPQTNTKCPKLTQLQITTAQTTALLPTLHQNLPKSQHVFYFIKKRQ